MIYNGIVPNEGGENMKEYKIVYQSEDGKIGYVYCIKNVRAEMKAIKELHEKVNNPIVAISYIRLGK